MFLLEGCYCTPKGKNREPGLQAICVSKLTGRQILYCPPFRNPALVAGFLNGAVAHQLLGARRACAYSIPPSLAPRINGFLFEKRFSFDSILSVADA